MAVDGKTNKTKTRTTLLSIYGRDPEGPLAPEEGQRPYSSAHLVEFFTWMRYLPEWMAKWKREAMKWYKHDSAFFVGLYNDVRKRVVCIRKNSDISIK